MVSARYCYTLGMKINVGPQARPSKHMSFSSTNRGTSACTICGVLSWAAHQDDTANRAMCRPCDDAAGLENEHQDSDGDHYGAGRNPRCPTCNPEYETLRLARAAKRVAGYQAAAAAKSAKAAEREAAKPHCPNCGRERPRTKATDRGEQVDCSTCKDYLSSIKYFAECGNASLVAEYQAKYAAERAYVARRRG